MTTHFRTLLLLGFTALVASLSGCILETTSGPGGNASGCSTERYFQVYWSIDNGPATTPLTCTQAPASHVELDTSTGTYAVGQECRATRYMGFVFDFVGSTVDGLPAGTYVTAANLISDGDAFAVRGTVLSTAPGAGPTYAIGSCTSTIVAYPFSLQ
jgi:hypothetical protein